VPFHPPETVDRISAKGKFAFELGEDGGFKIAEAQDTDNSLDCRSETSSMEANACTIPDINSIDIDDLEDWEFSTTLSQKPPLEAFKPSEKSELIGGLGEWTVKFGCPAVPPWVPWRLDAVSLDDLEDFELASHRSLSAENIIETKPQNSHTLFPQPQWNLQLASRPVAESGTESVPPLTEDYSRDSDSIAVSENVWNRDGPPSPRHVPAMDEGKAPLSPQLGSVGANFTTEFDQFAGTIESNFETNDRELASRRSPSNHGIFRSEASSGAVDFDTLTIGSATESESYQSDTESIWMSDYSESIPVLENDHPFMKAKSTVVREGLLAFQASQQERPQGGTSSNGTRSASTATSRDSDKKTGKKRNHRKRAGSERSKGSGDDEAAPEKRRRASKKASGNQVSFACPFAKKDPLKYRSCYAYIISRIQDVKLHLSRYHQLPIYCPRCMFIFETEDERDEHNRATSCVVQDAVRHEGVTRAQKLQLTQRVSSTMAAEDQWFTIFDILFPGHNPRPRSAYINVELTMELEGFQDLMLAQGPNIVSRAIHSRGIRISSETNEERDLSALLESAIEDGLQSITQQWFASYFPDPSTSQTAAADGSSSSHASHAVEGSDPSRASPDTLFEGAHQADLAVQQDPQSQQDDIRLEDDTQVPPQGHVEAPRDWLDMISDTPQLEDQTQAGDLSYMAPNTNQRGLEPPFESTMEGESASWEINQFCFFELTSYGATVDAAQVPENSEEFHAIVHERQDT
jgi:hypothetical protein